MNVLLVAGGKPETWPIFDKDYDAYIGIDRGSLLILEKGYPLDLAVGDFDSLTEPEKNRVFKQAKSIVTAPAEKDETDSQMGLSEALRHYPTAQIDMIGMTGGRLDHFLANLWMVFEPRFQVHISQLRICDNQNTIEFLLPGTYVIQKEQQMNYLAYACLTPVSNLTLTRSKYTLQKANFAYPTSLASNEFLEETADITFEQGIVAVIQSKDE